MGGIYFISEIICFCVGRVGFWSVSIHSLLNYNPPYQLHGLCLWHYFGFVINNLEMTVILSVIVTSDYWDPFLILTNYYQHWRKCWRFWNSISISWKIILYLYFFFLYFILMFLFQCHFRHYQHYIFINSKGLVRELFIFKDYAYDETDDVSKLQNYFRHISGSPSKCHFSSLFWQNIT